MDPSLIYYVVACCAFYVVLCVLCAFACFTVASQLSALTNSITNIFLFTHLIRNH